jgi:hypothetical protein
MPNTLPRRILLPIYHLQSTRPADCLLSIFPSPTITNPHRAIALGIEHKLLYLASYPAPAPFPQPHHHPPDSRADSQNVPEIQRTLRRPARLRLSIRNAIPCPSARPTPIRIRLLLSLTSARRRLSTSSPISISPGGGVLCSWAADGVSAAGLWPGARLWTTARVWSWVWWVQAGRILWRPAGTVYG